MQELVLLSFARMVTNRKGYWPWVGQWYNEILETVLTFLERETTSFGDKVGPGTGYIAGD